MLGRRLAIMGNADVLLTTDKKSIKVNQQIRDLEIKVKNPVNWFMKMINNKLFQFYFPNHLEIRYA